MDFSSAFSVPIRARLDPIELLLVCLGVYYAEAFGSVPHEPNQKKVQIDLPQMKAYIVSLSNVEYFSGCSFMGHTESTIIQLKEKNSAHKPQNKLRAFLLLVKEK